MQVKSISWIGFNCILFEESLRFYQDILCLELIFCNPKSQFALFRFSSGQDLEIFGPNFKWKKYHINPVLGFEVADIFFYRKHLEKKGIKFLTEIIKGEKWGYFCYIEGDNGQYIELVQRDTSLEQIKSSIYSYKEIMMYCKKKNEQAYFIKKITNLSSFDDRKKISFYPNQEQNLSLVSNDKFPMTYPYSQFIISLYAEKAEENINKLKKAGMVLDSKFFSKGVESFQEIVFHDPANNLFKILNKIDL